VLTAASNNPELGPVVVVGGYGFSAYDCLKLCASYCGWKILLQSIEHLGRQRAYDLLQSSDFPDGDNAFHFFIPPLVLTLRKNSSNQECST